MSEPRYRYLVNDPETGALRGAAENTLPEPVTAAEAGLMVGDPVPEHLRVHHGTWFGWPHRRWAGTHMDELRASARIRTAGPIGDRLPEDVPGLGVLEGMAVDDGEGGTWTIDEFLRRTYADGLLVAHRGRVVAEWYLDGMDRLTRHIMFSMTKTVTGVLALSAIHDGLMGLDDLLVDHVPELADCAYAPVTVRQALDMTDGIRFDEDYGGRDSDIHRYGIAMAFTPVPAGYDGPDGVHAGILDQRVRQHAPGEAFAYKSVTTDVLAWAVARATGKRWSDAVAESIWTPMGAEVDASVMLDDRGIAVSSGGMSCTLRDLVRFTRILGRSGRVGEGADERQAIPAAVADDIAGGGDPSGDIGDQYPTRRGWTYHRQCWNLQQVLGGFTPLGIGCQRSFCHPGEDLVVARFGSHPIGGNVANDVPHLSLYRQLLDRL